MERRMDLASGLYYSVTQEEITRRHELLREFMAQKDLGALLVLESHQEGYRKWISGVDGMERPSESCFLIPGNGEILHIIGNKMIRGEDEDKKPVGSMPDPEEAFDGIKTVYAISAFAIRRMLEEGPGKKIGLIHGDEMRAQLYDYLEEFLPEIPRVDVTGEFAAVRAVKSEEELALMERAAFLQERVLEGLESYIKPGMLEVEAVRYGRYLANRLESSGPDSMEYAQIRLISWKTHQEKEPLQYPGRYISEGDMVLIKLRLLGDSGYYGTVSRCFSLGQPSHRDEETWKKAALFSEKIEELIGPGISLRKLQEQGKKLAADMKLTLGREPFAHGIGYCVSETPDGSSMDLPLKAGMVIAVEPEIWDESGNLFCCGDMYEITETKAVRLTNASRELRII